MTNDEKKLFRIVARRFFDDDQAKDLFNSLTGGQATIGMSNSQVEFALDLSWLVDLFDKVDFKLIVKLLPVLLSIFQGGFTGPAILALIQVIADLFGVDQSTAQAMLMASLQPVAPAAIAGETQP